MMRFSGSAGLFLLLVCPAVRGQEGPAIDKAAESALQGLSAQRTLPSEAHAPPEKKMDIQVVVVPPKPSEQDSALPAGPHWGTLFRMLAWMTGLCLIVLAIAYVVENTRFFQKRFGNRKESPGSDDFQVTVTRHPEDILAGADEFAASGRYAEAMHRLLLDTVALLRKRLEAEIADSLTSRELLRVLVLAPEQKQALRDIVLRVEQTWFGDRPASREDYAAVRSSFRLVLPGAEMA